MGFSRSSRGSLALMITNRAGLDEFYKKLIETEDISHEKALSIYEALLAEAVNDPRSRRRTVL